MRIRAMTVTLAAAVLAALAGPAVAATASPAAPARAAALADTDGQPDPEGTIDPDITAVALCKSSGNAYCLHDNSGTEFLSVHASATPVKFKFNGNTWHWGSVTYNTGTLNEPGLSPACLGFNGFGNITRQNCDTGTGIIWGAGLSGGHKVYLSRLRTQQQGVIEVLAASDSLGSPLFLAQYPPGPGVYERFDRG